MGRDKATLPLQGQTLSEHVADLVSIVADTVLLVGHPERYVHLKYRCIPDLHPGLGPLSGVEAALSANLAELNVITACDIAGLRPSWLQALLAEASRGRRCVVLETPGAGLQPLCAVYRRDCLETVSQALRERRLRMMDLLRELSACSVRIEDRILNLNTPEDYSAVSHGNGTERPLY